MSLPEFTLNKLEFEKLREVLTGYLSTSTGIKSVQKLSPSGSAVTVRQKLEETSEMMRLLEASEIPPFQTLPDISDALAKAGIKRFVLDGKSLIQIWKWAETARNLRSFFVKHEKEATRLWKIARDLTPLKTLEQHILQAVNEKGEIKSDASPELARINKQISRRKQSMRTILQRILHQGKEAGFTDEEEATLRGGRMVIPVKSEYKRKVRGFIHDSSATGQTVYIEPIEVFDINNEVRELESARNREVERLLRDLTQQVGQHIDELSNNEELIGRLDVCYACAKLGGRWKGVISDISVDGSISLKECRNPLLLLKFNRHTDALQHVIPLNLNMDPGEKGIIITGPNAGGKSVTLKTFGLALVLTQCGIPIPALEGAKLPCIDMLFIDMGDEQSIDNDLSTFSSRLKWMRDVMAQAGPNSWILMDEAGSGTDPDEGTALVKAFLEILSAKGVRCIITTHHGALKIFAHETDGWSNASMKFDQQSLSPTYRFQKGIPGSSYAFEIAERMEIPEELVHRARGWVGSGKNKLESLIINLEQESQRLRLQKSELQRQEQHWKQSVDRLSNRLARIQEERGKIRNRAIEDAEVLLRDTNRKIEEAIRAASNKDKVTLKEKRSAIEKIEEQVRIEKSRQQKKSQQPITQQRPPQTGDAVRMMDSNTTGELVEISGKKATVIVNGLRIKTQYNNLERSDQRPLSGRTKGYKIINSGAVGNTLRPFSGSLDIRGVRGEKAIQILTGFIDEGLMRGLERLEVIHGKGDGILRKLVHEYLRSRPDIRQFETAPIQEGGEGCTYVYL
ncbi:MAG: endonuclease MutS2 [Balneolales bacterium]